MSTDSGHYELPIEIARLRRGERRYAADTYRALCQHYSIDPDDCSDKEMERVLNGAYSQAARYWLMLATFLAVPGAFILSIGFLLIGAPMLAGALVLFGTGIHRLIQALHFYPHLTTRDIE